MIDWEYDSQENRQFQKQRKSGHYMQRTTNVTNLAVFTVHKRLAKRGKYKAKNFSTHIITRMADEKCLVKWYAKFSLQ